MTGIAMATTGWNGRPIQAGELVVLANDQIGPFTRCGRVDLVNGPG
jgi:hypothetical protein